MKREIVGQGAVVVLVVAIVAAIVGGAIGYLLAPAEEVPPDIAELQAQISELQGTVSTQESKISDLEAQLAEVVPGQFKGMKVVWVGGAEGCPYNTLLMRGAADAEKYLGVDVDFVTTAWEPERMVEEFAKAIALHPDGIICMGHPGYEGYADLFQEATDAGIGIMMADVDVPQLRQEFLGVGYLGPDQYDLGQTMGIAGLAAYGDVSPGDRAAVISGSWDEPERAMIAQGAYDALAEGGLTVDKVEHPSAVYDDPSAGIPYVVGYYAAHPDVKLIYFDGGATTASTVMYMEALGVEPGEIIVVGLDISPGSLDALESGYLHATIDCQPYLQGYLTVLNVCLHQEYGFSGLFSNTAACVVTKANMDVFEDPAYEGYRY